MTCCEMMNKDLNYYQKTGFFNQQSAFIKNLAAKSLKVIQKRSCFWLSYLSKLFKTVSVKSY